MSQESTDIVKHKVVKLVMTEKSERNKQNHNCYVFKCEKTVHKTEIKRIIENRFSVNVVKVNTLKVRPMIKNVRMKVKKSAWKKVFVTLQQNQSINLEN